VTEQRDVNWCPKVEVTGEPLRLRLEIREGEGPAILFAPNPPLCSRGAEDSAGTQSKISSLASQLE